MFFWKSKAKDAEENLLHKQYLHYQIDVLNNLDLQKMETKSKSSLSNIKERELSKVNNDEL